MNSFMRFLRKMAKNLLLTPERLEAIGRIDPKHIYVENIRAVFGLTTPIARGLCELAVKQGILKKAVEVRCPDETSAAEAPTEAALPPSVPCWSEVDGNYKEQLLPTKNLKLYDFYIYQDEELA
jgi:hypothetical protein